MTKFTIEYNPYLTENMCIFKKNGKVLNENSIIGSKSNVRLQMILGKSRSELENWEGLPEQIAISCDDDEVEVYFKGRKMDFDDLKYTFDSYQGSVKFNLVFEETKNEMPTIVPAAVFRDPRYAVLYQLHKNLLHPTSSLDISNFYQFQWKRTDKLYELWGFLQFVKALLKKGWELEDGVSVIKEEGKYRLSSLESGTTIQMKRGDEEIHLLYDGLVPSTSAETNREKEPLYTNNAHRRPDLRLDYYQKNLYCGSLVVDFKYRDILFLWQDENRGEGLRRQFNAYRDMNTRFYRNMDEKTSLRDSRPVKEVWAVFPREVPGKADQDYSLKFIPLSPGQESNAALPELLENYLASLRG